MDQLSRVITAVSGVRKHEGRTYVRSCLFSSSSRLMISVATLKTRCFFHIRVRTVSKKKRHVISSVFNLTLNLV